MQDGTAASGDGVDGHHRRAHAYPGYLGLEGALELARKMRHIGGSPTHVEADDLAKTSHLRRAHRADDAAGRAGENGILALEAACIRQPAVGLHEHQAHAFQFGGDLIDVAPQYRRQIGVDHGGVAAAHQFHHRAHLVRHRDPAIADGACHRRHLLLVLLVAVAVHEHDGERAVALIVGSLQIATGALDVKRREHLAARPYALLHLHHLAVEQLGQDDMARENLRPVLVGDPERVAKSPGDEQHGAIALSFQQRIGGHGRSHFHHCNLFGRDSRAGRDAKHMANAGERCVAVVFRVFRKQLVRGNRAIRPARDDVGEGAAAIDPELPAR